MLRQKFPQKKEMNNPWGRRNPFFCVLFLSYSLWNAVTQAENNSKGMTDLLSELHFSKLQMIAVSKKYFFFNKRNRIMHDHSKSEH